PAGGTPPAGSTPPAGGTPATGGTPPAANPPAFDAPPPPSYQAAAGAGHPSPAGYAARPVAVPRTRRPRSFLGRYTAAAVLVVPSDVAVDFRGHTGAGDIYLFDVVRNGIDVTLRSLVPGAQPASPRLVLDAEASVGQIRVIRGAAPAPVAPAVTSTAG